MKTDTIRKPYKSDENKGTVQVKFNLTPKQAERFSSKVEQSNLSISEFIRQKIGIR